MPRDPNIPDASEVYTVVLLRRPAHPQPFSEAELDPSVQAGRLAFDVFEWWMAGPVDDHRHAARLM